MRIVVLTDLYPPAAGGGYERSCADVVHRWRCAGHQVLVLTTPGDVPSVGGVRRDLPFGPAARATDADERRAADAVDAAVRDLRPDVVSAWNLARVPQRGVLDAVARARVPLVIVACDAWLADTSADLPRPAPGSTIAWVSADLRDRTALPPWAPRSGTVIGSGIDGGVFPARRSAAPRPWRGGLLFVGRLSPAKGVDDAVAALAHLADRVRLHVVGAGTDERRAELHDLAARIGAADRLSTAQGDRADLPQIYRAADVLLFPSRWAEPFGLVPLEAMACSTPVIATGTGGSADYLVDGANAMLVAPHDPPAIAAAVTRLAAHPALRARLVRHGLRTARAHDIDHVAAALGTVHERAASASS